MRTALHNTLARHRQAPASGRHGLAPHKATAAGAYVDPELRGRGVNRRFLGALVAHTPTVPGMERLTLAVTTAQPAARALYQRLGFVPRGTEPTALKLDDDGAVEYLDEEYVAHVL